jgi:hypothetical protein
MSVNITSKVKSYRENSMNNSARRLIPCAGLFLCGCSLFTAPMEKPVLVDTYEGVKGKTLALAATADRREIVFYPNGHVCMEAPPDISENISANLTNQLSASAKTPANISATVQDDIAHQVASAVAYASKPSQGLIFYRNGMSWLCNEYENQVIDLPQYGGAANEMWHVSTLLTAMEIAVTNGKIGPDSILATPSSSNESKTGVNGAAPASDAQAATPPATSTTKPTGGDTTTATDKLMETALKVAKQLQNTPSTGNAAAAPNPASDAQTKTSTTESTQSSASLSPMTGDQRLQMFNSIRDYIVSITRPVQTTPQNPTTSADKTASDSGKPASDRK